MALFLSVETSNLDTFLFLFVFWEREIEMLSVSFTSENLYPRYANYQQQTLLSHNRLHLSNLLWAECHWPWRKHCQWRWHIWVNTLAWISTQLTGKPGQPPSGHHDEEAAQCELCQSVLPAKAVEQLVKVFHWKAQGIIHTNRGDQSADNFAQNINNFG